MPLMRVFALILVGVALASTQKLPPIKKWGKTELTYSWTRNATSGFKDKVIKSMGVISSGTCITFKEGTPGRTDFKIVYTGSVPDCYAVPGKLSDSYMVLGDECVKDDSPMIPTHELMHILGYVHEHARPDAKNFLHTLLKHSWVEPAQYQIEQDAFNLITPFDYGSIMMYDAQDSGNKPGILVARPYNKYYVRTMGENQQIAFYDYAKINWIYCNETCARSRNIATCDRKGYPNPAKCNECNCPSGFTAKSNCTQLMDNSCSQTLQATAAVKTLRIDHTKDNAAYCYSHIKVINQPTSVPPINESNSQTIKADPGKRISISVKVYGVAPKICKPGYRIRPCVNYFVEVRYSDDLANSGVRLCCSEIFRNVSATNEILLLHAGKVGKKAAKVENYFNITFSTTD